MEAGQVAHVLKVWPKFYPYVRDNRKTFEVRRNDRGFRLGDTVELKEYVPETDTFTGESVTRKVTFILYGPGFGLEAGYCILALRTDNKSIKEQS